MTLLDDGAIAPARCGVEDWLGACQCTVTHVVAVTCPAGHRQTRAVCFHHGHDPEAGNLGSCPVCAAAGVANPLLLAEPTPVGSE